MDTSQKAVWCSPRLVMLNDHSINGRGKVSNAPTESGGTYHCGASPCTFMNIESATFHIMRRGSALSHFAGTGPSTYMVMTSNMLINFQTGPS